MDCAAGREGATGGTAEPLSWPELFGLVVRETGLPPREVAQMDSDDLEDLAASWRRLPPAAVTLERIRSTLMVGLGVKERSAFSPQKPQTEEETRRLVDLLNGRNQIVRQADAR